MNKVFLTFMVTAVLIGGGSVHAQESQHSDEVRVTCPALIAGMELKEKRDDAECTYVRGNADLRLVLVSKDEPSLKDYAVKQAQTLNIKPREKVSSFCNKGYAKKFAHARCIVSYNPNVIGLVSEITHKEQRMQARLMLPSREGVNQEQLYWSILASRTLLEKVTAE